ncbi:MAG: hypothetical protein V1870_01000 [Candidatus Aenigmatarchaeota archaeon]
MDVFRTIVDNHFGEKDITAFNNYLELRSALYKIANQLPYKNKARQYLDSLFSGINGFYPDKQPLNQLHKYNPNISIEDVGFEKGGLNVIGQCRVKTLGDVKSAIEKGELTEEILLTKKYSGPAKVKEILEVLKKYGIGFNVQAQESLEETIKIPIKDYEKIEERVALAMTKLEELQTYATDRIGGLYDIVQSQQSAPNTVDEITGVLRNMIPELAQEIAKYLQPVGQGNGSVYTEEAYQKAREVTPVLVEETHDSEKEYDFSGFDMPVSRQDLTKIEGNTDLSLKRLRNLERKGTDISSLTKADLLASYVNNYSVASASEGSRTMLLEKINRLNLGLTSIEDARKRLNQYNQPTNTYLGSFEISALQNAYKSLSDFNTARKVAKDDPAKNQFAEYMQKPVTKTDVFKMGFSEQLYYNWKPNDRELTNHDIALRAKKAIERGKNRGLKLYQYHLDTMSSDTGLSRDDFLKQLEEYKPSASGNVPKKEDDKGIGKDTDTIKSYDLSTPLDGSSLRQIYKTAGNTANAGGVFFSTTLRQGFENDYPTLAKDATTIPAWYYVERVIKTPRITNTHKKIIEQQLGIPLSEAWTILDAYRSETSVKKKKD